MLENAGPSFRASERFSAAIRQYLCLSLLKNSASSIPAALQLSAAIFLTLLLKFRAALKAEVRVGRCCCVLAFVVVVVAFWMQRTHRRLLTPLPPIKQTQKTQKNNKLKVGDGRCAWVAELPSTLPPLPTSAVSLATCGEEARSDEGVTGD